MTAHALKGAHVPDDDAAPVPQQKTFTQFLHEQRRGLLHQELSDVLAEAGRAVAEHEKPATITLKIKIAPMKKYPGAVEVTDTVTSSLPEADRHAGIFYPDEHGNLNRNDPRQPELPLNIAGANAQNRTAS
jgi:hypothetical protein